MLLRYKNKEIKLIECKSFYSRFKGFMFSKNIDEALLFRNCNSVHTCFMKDKIDIIMCDKNYRVKYYYRDFGKWKFILPKREGCLTIETPSSYFDIEIGDVMEVIE